MTSPIKRILVQCPQCGQEYEDWYHPSINLMLDDFDDDYLDQATSATCPNCGTKVPLSSLIVDKDGVFHVPE